jgi:hypothetical protein
MKSKLFWLGSALCGALLINGCSSGGTGDGGTTTTGGGTTAAVTSGTTGHVTTSGSTSGSTSAGTTGASTSGTTSGTTSAGTTGSSTTGTTSTGGTTGAVDAGVGTSCDATATPDATCAPFGLACKGVNVSDGGIVGTCILPVDQNTCLASVGCAPGFFCVAGVFATGTTCVQSCQQSSECGNPIEACVSGVIATNDAGCVLNACGPGSSPANGSGYYSPPCNAQATGDGTCLPFTSTQAFCEQDGTVALNQPCGLQRNGAVGLCQSGSTCVTLNVSNGGVFALKSACLAPCAFAAPAWSDGGPVCDATSICENVFGFPFGACFETCVLANPTCPSPLVCLNVGTPPNGICGPG